MSSRHPRPDPVWQLLISRVSEDVKTDPHPAEADLVGSRSVRTILTENATFWAKFGNLEKYQGLAQSKKPFK